MLNLIDRLLDGITMYRLVLYYLIGLLLAALGLSLFGVISYSPFAILFSVTFILTVCYLTNMIFSKVFEVGVNAESWIITGLILSLILSPSTSRHALPLYFWAGVLAISPKFMFAIKGRHIFNPAAAAVVCTYFGLGLAASWWVGTAWMVPFVIAGGLLLVKKIQRWDMVITFFIVATLASLTLDRSSNNKIDFLQRITLDSSLFFLGFVMLTEPLTSPHKKKFQIIYAAIVGLIFPPQIHIGSFYSTPELALMAGNAFSYLVSPKYRLMLSNVKKIPVGQDLIDFIFPLKKKLYFAPGEYMEWTIPHKSPDSRGNRRYFTIASSPTEDTLRLGVKFYQNGSSFKKAMQNMDESSTLLGGQLAGEFTLPKDKSKKLVFVAGGIGITPYRSILKYLLDTKEKRDIVLMYSNKAESEIMYDDVFSQAEKELGIKKVYTITEGSLSKNWKGRSGRIDAKMIQSEVPDFKDRIFYLSGPHVMVTAFEQTLKEIGISQNQIKIDFFPGYV